MQMKTFVFGFLFIGIFINHVPNSDILITSEIITATYEGLTENLEFQFIAGNGKIYLFEEIDVDTEYDLYDEMYVGKKFRVTWEKRTIRVLDDEDEPTGEIREIKVILGLKLI
jgi:hypothetical protein